MMPVRFAAALALLITAPGRLVAGSGGGATASADLRYAGGTSPNAVSLATSARLWLAPGWAGGVDLEAGGASSGVIYEAIVWPGGLGVRAAPSLDIAARGGTGISRAAGAGAAGFLLAGELTCDIDLHRVAHVVLTARVAWDLRARRDPALAAFAADELTIGAALRLGRASFEYNGRAARGIMLKLGWSSDGAGHAAVIGIGYGLDVRWADSPAPFPGWPSWP